MIGRIVSANKISHSSVLKSTLPTVLVMDSVSALGNSNSLLLKDIRLDLRKGEILGVAGVDGNGQNELAEVIAGIRKIKYGQIYIDGQPIANLPPRQIRRLGLAYVPEDCTDTGLILEHSIVENMVLDRWYTKPYCNRLFLNKMEMMKFAIKIIADFEIKISDLSAPVSSMSGGNLQKIVLGRELSRYSKVVIVHNPTRGLDIAATEFIHKQLVKQKENGVGVLLLSLDLDEVLRLSDRIAVIYEGKIITIVENQDIDIDQIGLLMGGKTIKK
jgi:simple sugar transport system ATP-binding protein